MELSTKYLLRLFVLSLRHLVNQVALRRREEAAPALTLQDAGVAGPGRAGRLGGQVTGHKLVVLLVGPYGQCGLALQTGGQI